MDFDQLLAEADAQEFVGWDFSYLEGRSYSEGPSWDYTALVSTRAAASDNLLDMGTGGGEWLAQLSHRPTRTVATEAWPPNVTVAADRLRPIGVAVVQVEPAPDNVDQVAGGARGGLPFRHASFSLVINRHESFVAAEVARILEPGGVFVTQQVDTQSFDDMFRLLGLDPPPASPRTLLAVTREQVDQAGLRIVRAEREATTRTFTDVGAFAWTLKVLPAADWGLDDFTIDRYRDALVAVHARIRHEGHVAVHETRMLLEAEKP